MVNNAIKSFEEHHHKPSLLDIKNFISANYKIDVEKLSPFIKKYLNDAVTGGKLIQTNDDSSCDKYESAQRKELKASAQKVMKRRPASTSDKKTKVVAPVKPDFTDVSRKIVLMNLNICWVSLFALVNKWFRTEACYRDRAAKTIEFSEWKNFCYARAAAINGFEK